MSSFLQYDKQITRERNVIDLGDYSIYGGHFMNRQCQTSDKQIRKRKSITTNQPLNYIRLFKAGNMQGCFIESKLYFSLSKMVSVQFFSCSAFQCLVFSVSIQSLFIVYLAS